MSKMADLPLRRTPESDFTFWMFLGRMKESNFVKFVFFTASIAFGANVAGPYFSVYMLRDLRLDYLTYTFLHLAAAVSGLIAYPIWGRHADAVGNVKILKFTGFFLPVLPVLWLVSQNLAYLIVVQILGGFLWGGFILCGTNFIYDAASPEKRVRCLGYFNLINGAAIFAGASLGGFLADRLPAILGFRLFSLFVLSGALRFIFYVLLSGRFHEVRGSVRPVSGARLFASLIGLRSLTGEK
jgi:MFS family permease